MNEKIKKGVVLFLAVLTALAFAPFVFQPPTSPEQQQQQQQNIEQNINSTSSVTTSTEADL